MACRTTPVPNRSSVGSRTQYYKNRRHAFIARGLCSRCGKKELYNSSYCDTCTLKRKVYVNSVRSHRKSRNECIECKKPTSARSSRCRVCTTRNTQVVAKRQKSFKNNGLCTRCGLRPRINKSYCIECGHKVQSKRSGYKLTLEEKNEMLRAQDNKCAICKRPPKRNSSLHVDHCHMTGKVRELLCSDCNMTLGKYNDDPVMFEHMASYIRKHQPKENASGIDIGTSPSVVGISL